MPAYQSLNEQTKLLTEQILALANQHHQLNRQVKERFDQVQAAFAKIDNTLGQSIRQLHEPQEFRLVDQLNQFRNTHLFVWAVRPTGLDTYYSLAELVERSRLNFGCEPIPSKQTASPGMIDSSSIVFNPHPKIQSAATR